MNRVPLYNKASAIDTGAVAEADRTAIKFQDRVTMPDIGEKTYIQYTNLGGVQNEAPNTVHRVEIQLAQLFPRTFLSREGLTWIPSTMEIQLTIAQGDKFAFLGTHQLSAPVPTASVNGLRVISSMTAAAVANNFTMSDI